MANEIEVLYPYENSEKNFPGIHNDFHNILVTMPMFANVYYYMPNSSFSNWHFHAYSSVYGWRSLTGGNDFPFYLWFTAPYFEDYSYRQLFVYNNPSQSINMALQNVRNDFWGGYGTQDNIGYGSVNIYNLRKIIMYKFSSQNVNGYWLDYTRGTGANKIFIVKCINELTGDEEETPILATNYGRNNGSNWCRIHPYSSIYVDIKDWKISNIDIGFSNTYVMRQVRYENYFFPNVYIISGGLFYSDRDIITIDNNTYVHMCNDIYIRL